MVAVELIPGRALNIRTSFAGAPPFQVLSMDVRRAISLLERKGRSFDVVFADPPYGAGWPKLLGAILFPTSGGVIRPGGIAVVEHSIREPLPFGVTYLIKDQREYGETALSFLVPRILEGER